jgi:sugar/nucleoside kinase (ribokinase family)
MSGRDFDCLCAGIVVADHVCAPIADVPPSGGLALTARMDLTVGGCAANVAADLARLGRRVGLSGLVGRDPFGRHVGETLAAAGVDCGLLRESDTRETSGTLVINVRGQDRRFIHSIGANGEYTAAELTAETLRRTRVLYLGGYLLVDSLRPEDVAAAFRAARSLGVRTVLDVVLTDGAGCWERLAPVLPETDVFLPNTDEARAITGLDDPREQAERFHAAGAGTVVITCGEAGAVLVGESARLRCGRYDVEAVDGTGSGDAFAAGYIHGLLREAPPSECLRLGAALGASCVRAMGATTGVFTADELDAFCRERPLTVAPL